MTSEQLLAYLRRELADRGLISLRFYQQNGLLLRVRCHLPYITVPDKRETFADEAEVLLFRRDERWQARLEHPGPGCVMHPNWDANGYWHSEKLDAYRNSGPEEMCSLLGCIIRSLNFEGDAYSLTNAVNRNAVAWCYANGKDNRRISFVSGAPAQPPRSERRETRRIQIAPGGHAASRPTTTSPE